MTEKTEFKGDLLDYVKLHGVVKILEHEGEFYIPVRPICKILGLTWKAQHRKLMADYATIYPPRKMRTLGADGKNHEMFCVAWPDFIWWLLSIKPERVKPGAREAVYVMRQDMRHLLNEDFKARIGRVPQ